MNGTIKTLIPGKGFGFISSPELTGGKDLFFHATSLVGMTLADLHEGDAVTFDMEDSPKGPNAKNVKRA